MVSRAGNFNMRVLLDPRKGWWGVITRPLEHVNTNADLKPLEGFKVDKSSDTKIVIFVETLST